MAFSQCPTYIGIGKLVVCNNRKKQNVLSILWHSCIPLVLSMGAGSASSLLLKPSTNAEPAQSDQIISLAGQSVCRITTYYSLCNLQCQHSCTMAIKKLGCFVYLLVCVCKWRKSDISYRCHENQLPTRVVVVVKGFVVARQCVKAHSQIPKTKRSSLKIKMKLKDGDCTALLAVTIF